MKDIFSKTIRKLRNLGKNRKGVFVCNLNLKKSFNVGDEVDYSYDFENKVLTVIKNQNGSHRVSFRKSDATTIQKLIDIGVSPLFLFFNFNEPFDDDLNKYIKDRKEIQLAEVIAAKEKELEELKSNINK